MAQDNGAMNNPEMDVDWSGEIRFAEQNGRMPAETISGGAGNSGAAPYYHISYNELRGDDFPQIAGREELNLTNPLTQEEMANPMSNSEVYQGSMKSLLARNIGYYVVATFQMGSQGTVSVPGVLHTVGNDYIVLYQPENGRYVTGDFYSLKFVDFHETMSIPRRYF